MFFRRWFVILSLLSFAGCLSWRGGAPPLPVTNSVSLDQLVVYSDFQLPKNHRLLQELDAMRTQISTRLALPISDEPIHVYLFKTPRRYRAFLKKHYPKFPDRRAFFIQTDTRLSVYAYWGDRIAEDLRHEVSHGYLHSVVPNLPLWLDEGLAESFEVSSTNRGLNRAHLDHLLVAIQRGEWEPNLARLDQFNTLNDMDQLDYAESWAWTHMLLETSVARRELVQRHLQDLHERTNNRPLTELIAQSEPNPNAALVAHLRALGAAMAPSDEKAE